MLNTGAPQSCVLSPLLFTMYTHNHSPRHGDNVWSVDHNTMIGQIKNNNDGSYKVEINSVADWCTENNVLLNIN